RSRLLTSRARSPGISAAFPGIRRRIPGNAALIPGLLARRIYDSPCPSHLPSRTRDMALQKAEPGKTRIGWIGTGVMGRWMCQHVRTKGYAATVYNRSKDKAKPLLDAGATYAESPQKVAERSDVVFAI